MRADAYRALRLLDLGLTAWARHWAEGAELRQRGALLRGMRCGGGGGGGCSCSRLAVGVWCAGVCVFGWLSPRIANAPRRKRRLLAGALADWGAEAARQRMKRQHLEM